jgi:hypothetical protein
VLSDVRVSLRWLGLREATWVRFSNRVVSQRKRFLLDSRKPSLESREIEGILLSRIHEDRCAWRSELRATAFGEDGNDRMGHRCCRHLPFERRRNQSVCLLSSLSRGDPFPPVFVMEASRDRTSCDLAAWRQRRSVLLRLASPQTFRDVGWGMIGVDKIVAQVQEHSFCKRQAGYI